MRVGEQHRSIAVFINANQANWMQWLWLIVKDGHYTEWKQRNKGHARVLNYYRRECDVMSIKSPRKITKVMSIKSPKEITKLILGNGEIFVNGRGIKKKKRWLRHPTGQPSMRRWQLKHYIWGHLGNVGGNWNMKIISSIVFWNNRPKIICVRMPISAAIMANTYSYIRRDLLFCEDFFLLAR